MTDLPSWWKEAISIEYLDCRDFTHKEGRFGKFDFEMVDQLELEHALRQYKVVSYGQLIQNTDPKTFSARMVMGLVSPITKPIIDGKINEIIPNGVVSKHHFPFLGNSIDVVDPIEGFNSYIQVLDDGVLYQWEVARLENVEGRHYGRWVSDYVDLSDFDKLHDEFQDVMRKKQSLPTEDYSEVAQAYVKKLRKLRLSAFSKLLTVHEKLKESDFQSRKKTVAYKPPSLSHFETMKIENNEIYTVCMIAPVFYRAARKHIRAAEKLTQESGGEHPSQLDKIYEERAQAIIMSAACFEAIANEVGSHTFKSNWVALEKLTPIEKLKLVFSYSEPSEELDISKHPFQLLSKIISTRNEMIHFKHEYKKVKVENGVAISKMEALLNKELIANLSNVLSDGIEKIYMVSGFDSPKWLNDQAGWSISKDA
ncbi:hypothetical protein HYO24_21985 [Vibrio parahaemolyticus]|nr:hypothetical protein [Vibrio parahaemolyticus]MBM4964242.1 hypothetical protein [Vibrio parahaemolyticus]